MSTRREVAENIGKFLNETELNQVYGIIDVNQGKFRSLCFAKARMLDGEVRVYSPKFIQVKWQTAIRALPERASRVFTSEEDTKTFLRAAFVDYDFDAAYSVPTK